MRQRRVDVHRFAGCSLLMLCRHAGHRAHVVQTVRQFDQDDPGLVSHRQDHLAERFGLLIRLRFRAGSGQLCTPVDDCLHDRPEPPPDLGELDIAILDNVMAQRTNDGVLVHPITSQNRGHGHGVRDVRLAARPPLPTVVELSELVGRNHPVGIGLRADLGVRGEKVCDLLTTFGLLTTPRENSHPSGHRQLPSCRIGGLALRTLAGPRRVVPVVLCRTCGETIGRGGAGRLHRT